MRALRALFCAVALAAFLAPGVRADEYTKQTFLTFSGPVQLPGVTLAAGTYMFKLADPETDRRAIQVWDKDGTKLYTTLLTIPDQRMKVTDNPVVMFSERPSGEAQAIRSWFYPDESYGFEFIYPKQQAARIAKENHSTVAAFSDDKSGPESFKTARIGRMDENGRMTNADKPASTVAANETNQNAPAPTAPAASTTTADQASTTTADRKNDTAAVTTTAPAASVRASGTTASSRDNTTADRTVGTSGTTSSTAPRVNQADRGRNAAAPTRNELPRTAGSTTIIELLGVMALAAAATVRSLRIRLAESR
jgi:hypothetical protein